MSQRDHDRAAPGRRRRGAELENALLEAAWAELVTFGYANLTIDSVATRAETSRAVLYRRWQSRSDLALAAIRHHHDIETIDVPDTGSLRDDLLILLREASEHRSELAALVSVHLADFYSETGASPAELRDRLLGERRTWMDTVLQRAHERGEIDLDTMPPRVAALPFDLFRHEVLMTLRPVSEEFVVSVVDDIFLPLVLAR